MSSNFLDALLNGGDDYRVSFTSDGATLRPASDTDEALSAFQAIVSAVEVNEGFGYRIFKYHESSDRPGNRVDLLMLKLDEGSVSHSEEGRLAFQGGRDIVDCPYTYPPFRDAWKAGWSDAEENSGSA